MSPTHNPEDLVVFYTLVFVGFCGLSAALIKAAIPCRKTDSLSGLEAVTKTEITMNKLTFVDNFSRYYSMIVNYEPYH